MCKEFPVLDLAKREQNFFNANQPSTIRNIYYYKLTDLVHNVRTVVNSLQERDSSSEKKLRTVFSCIYDFVIENNDDYTLFDNNMELYNDVFEVCLFVSLCMFLYETKRIKGISLRRLIYQYSPMDYKTVDSPNYFDYRRSKHFCESSSDKPERTDTSISSDEMALRQYRKRFLSGRPVYIHDTEWSAIRKVSEHEWELYFILDKADPEIRDTFKRIRVLYSALNKALNSPLDDGYINRLEVAFSKFSSRLKKIQYARFLNLGKFCLDHICNDKTCYGINLYRFEKELRLYAVTGEVRQLLNCKTIDEEQDILTKSIVLKDIPFPKLYKYFGNLKNIRQSETYVRIFWSFMDNLIRSSRLAIDRFVEEGAFGEDWENLFLDITNKLAESVLYDPKVIDCSVEPKSQEMFMKDVSAPVEARIAYMTELWPYRPNLSDSEDDTI